MARYGIATLFEDYPDGHEFTEANTPLHLTHVDVLNIDLEPDKFISRLTNHLRQELQFSIVPIKDTNYGPNKDIPVTEIELNPSILGFHKRLMDFLVSGGATFDNPQFLNESYSPHISIYGTRRVKISVPIKVKSVSIGNKRTDIDNPPNRIIATIPLLAS